MSSVPCGLAPLAGIQKESLDQCRCDAKILVSLLLKWWSALEGKWI